MKTPRLRETVTYYAPAEGQTTDWGASDGDTYEKAGTRKAEVEEDGGDLDRRAGRDEPRQRVTLKMRQWEKVSTKGYFEWRGKTLWVAGVKAMDRDRRWMEVKTYLDPDG